MITVLVTNVGKMIIMIKMMVVMMMRTVVVTMMMMMMTMTALAAGMQQRWSLQQLAEEQHMPTSPADTLIIANDGDDDEYHGDDVDENCDDYVL